ncbi:hypothetical protein GNI_064470 [Gregarina niphandrodes]|uniref:Uncharacterized protein n=1 Tax=Gregarina niphandrodes TaxID=110365 RepID=A0A023B807_GRENI|nr:hypothetical protein GNI_064470 [Gregarina niphandrodes]EZG68118.1 hypothetical protein GNI_064470 [Gregarina niphandrodes]|eukprot:XP_011130103.1 hypothetical protein GNI_064470 [Gregarina niphandrodes]
MPKEGGRKLRKKSRPSGSQKRRAPVVDAKGQLEKWARLEETLRKKKKQGRNLDLHPTEALRKARKASKHKGRNRAILDDWESSTVAVSSKPSAPKEKRLTIKELARRALQEAQD